MKVAMGFVFFLMSCVGFAQTPGSFVPATTNVWDAEYPRVDASGRVQVRVKAPDATKVKLNFWSGPKIDMEKQSDGFWTATTTPLVPGLHYYVINVDGADLSDCVARSALGCGRPSRTSLRTPINYPVDRQS